MAISRDTHSVADTGTTLGVGVSTATYSYTNSGNFLKVDVFTNTGDFLSGVTYNGVSMTTIKQQQGASGSYVYTAYLLNAPTGTHNIVVTLNSTNKYLEVLAVSYNNASISALDASNTAGNTSTAITCAVTTVADNCWVLGTGRSDTGTQSAGTNTTKLDGRDASGGLWNFEYTSNPKTPAGSTTIGMNNTASNNNGFITISIAPLVSSAGDPIVHFI